MLQINKCKLFDHILFYYNAMCKRGAFLESPMAKNGFWSKVLNISPKWPILKFQLVNLSSFWPFHQPMRMKEVGVSVKKLWFSGLLPCMTLVTFQNSLTDTCWFWINKWTKQKSAFLLWKSGFWNLVIIRVFTRPKKFLCSYL